MKAWTVLLLMSILLCSCSLFPDQKIASTFTNSLGGTTQSFSVHPIHNPKLKVSSSKLANGETGTVVLAMQEATMCDGCCIVEIGQEGTTTSVE